MGCFPFGVTMNRADGMFLSTSLGGHGLISVRHTPRMESLGHVNACV